MITRLKVSDERISIVAKKLRLIGLQPILLIEQDDPQFKAVKKVVNDLNDKCIAFLLIVLNAVVSYRLSSPGEEYWLEFANYISKTEANSLQEAVRALKSFLAASKGNRLLRSQKVRRIDKLSSSNSLNSLLSLCRSGKIDLVKISDILAEGLGSRRNSKTIVFACKMSYYFLKAIGLNITPPFEIDIPVDRRIALISYTSGLVEINPHVSGVKRLIPVLLRNSDLIASVWRKISNISLIPPLNIDSLIWLISRDIGIKPVNYVKEQALKKLSRIVDYTLAKSFLEELFRNEYTV